VFSPVVFVFSIPGRISLKDTLWDIPIRLNTIDFIGALKMTV
jgi:hypothetical protein